MYFKPLISILFISICFNQAFSQYEKILKENLSPKARIYWDNQKKHLQAIGSYYVNEEKVVLNKI